jgi:type III pantothenate kinase
VILIDLGNTLAKWRVIDSVGKVKAGVDELAGLPRLKECVSSLNLNQRKIYLSSVRVRHAVQELADRFDCSLEEARPLQDFGGFKVDESNLSMMGVDRWLICVALMASRGGGFIVISAGTAITVDVVDTDGAHCGGYIAPGFHMLANALSANADRIPLVDVSLLDAPGHSTTEAVSAGVSAMFLGFLHEVLRRHQNSDMEVIVCGGDASKIMGEFSMQAKRIDDLVLNGLHYFALHTGTL